METVPGARLAEDDPRAFETALRLLQRGQLIALPTDTVYGISAHALRPEAVMKVFAAKRRPLHKAIPLLLSEVADVCAVAAQIPSALFMLAEQFWPGPLTLVLHRAPNLPNAVTGGGDTVAVRVPDRSFPRRLAAGLSAPLATTSANLAGQPNSLTADAVERALGDHLGLIVDGGPSPGGRPSTVVDLLSDPPRILRAGPITAEQIDLALRSVRTP